MFNRLRRKKEVEGKVQDASGPESKGEPGAIATSGFICPTCMLSLPTPEELQGHWENVHNTPSSSNSASADSSSASIVPSSSANRDGDVLALRQEVEDLKTSLKEEKWYSQELKKEVDRMQEVNIQQKLLKDINTVDSNDLDQFELYREELKKSEDVRALLTSDVRLLRQQVTDKNEEFQALKKQKEIIEQKAAQLANNVVTLKAKVDEDQSHVSGLIETLENTLTELGNKKKEVRKLESELLQRPGADDVLVLKKELVSVQTLMDKSNLEKESLQNKLQLDFIELQEKYNRLQMEHSQAPSIQEFENLKKTLSQSNVDNKGMQEEVINKNQQIQDLQQKITQFENKLVEHKKTFQLVEESTKEVEKYQQKVSVKEEQNNKLLENLNELKEKLAENDFNLKQKMEESKQTTHLALNEKEQLITTLRLEIARAQNTIAEKEGIVEDQQKQLEDVQTQYQQESSSNEELKATSRIKLNELEETTRQLQLREAKIQELETSSQKLIEDVTKLESERAELIAKIEAGEGVATAINQLKQENADIQTKLATCEQKRKDEFQKHGEEVNVLHKQLQQLKGNCEEITDKLQKTEANYKEQATRLNNSQEKVAVLESDLKAKGELLLATEAAKETQRVDLESHIRTAQSAGQDRQQELTRAQQQLQLVTEELGEKKEKYAALEISLAELHERNRSLKNKCEELQISIINKESIIEDENNKNYAQQKSIENLTLQLVSSKEELVKVQVELEVKAENENRLSGRIEEMEKITSILQEELKSSQLGQEQLKENIAERDSSLAKQSELLLAAQAANETQRIDLENHIKTAQSALHDKQQELSRAQQQLQLTSQELAEKKEHCTSLEISNAEVNQRISLLKDKCEDLQANISNKENLLEQTNNENQDRQKSIESLNLQLVSIKEDVNRTRVELYNKVQDADKLNQLLADTERRHALLQEEIESSKQEKEELNSKITEQDNSLAKLLTEHEQQQQKLEQKEELQKNLQRQIEVLEQEVKKSCEQCKNYETQVVKLQFQLKEINEKHSKVENDLLAANKSLVEKDDELNLSKKSEASLKVSIGGLQEVKNRLDSKISLLEKELDDTIQKQKLLQEEKKMIEIEKEKEKSSNQKLTELKLTLEEDLKSLNQSLECQKEENIKEVSGLQDAKQILIKQKLDLQSQLTELENQLGQSRAQHEETKEVAKRVQTMLSDESAALQSKLTAEIQVRQDLEKDKEETEAKMNMQLTALNENLGTLRSELALAEGRIRELSRLNDENKDKLGVQETLLQNMQDERRALLERCLSGENDLEKLQNKNAELRRSLEDAQAAMHELGRENQSLQIANVQKNARKWQDDDQITNCQACNKSFSVTVRKHHCRSCGNIFCNECSSKSTAIASSKKPVRVCDNCYTEVTNS